MSLRGYSDNELIHRVEAFTQGFDGWKKGVYDCWVRANKSAKEVDIFADKAYTFVVGDDGIPQFRMVCTGTSLTGSWALKNYRQYSKLGAAVLASNQFVRDSHFYGTHKGYAAYRQGKPFPFYRDGDLDSLAEELGELHTNEIILANCHRAKQNATSTIIYNWSAACLVRASYTQWCGWLAFMNKRPLSVAILREWD